MRSAMASVGVLAAALLVNSLAAQTGSNIDPTASYAWGENIGWTNWYDAGASGAVVHESFLSGFVWGENVGWINLGDGSPTNGVAYANVDGTDFGVNYDIATGLLSGWAWGENVGWIRFSCPTLSGTERAHLDPCSRLFGGYAWGENVGWLNLGAALEVFGPASDLGYALAGTGGVAPRLCAYGLTSSGDVTEIVLLDGRPNAFTGILISLFNSPTPFKGGFLVPIPIMISLYVTTDANGDLWFPLPGIPVDLPADLYFQCAIKDSGGPFGWSLSNAIALHYLP